MDGSIAEVHTPKDGSPPRIAVQAFEYRVALDEQQPGVVPVECSKERRERRIVIAKRGKHLRQLRTLRRHLCQELTGFVRAPSARKNARSCRRETGGARSRERVHLVQQLERVVIAPQLLENLRKSSVRPVIPWFQFERSLEPPLSLVEPAYRYSTRP